MEIDRSGILAWNDKLIFVLHIGTKKPVRLGEVCLRETRGTDVGARHLELERRREILGHFEQRLDILLTGGLYFLWQSNMKWIDTTVRNLAREQLLCAPLDRSTDVRIG